MRKYSRHENKVRLDIALKEKEEVETIEKDLEEKGSNSEYYIYPPNLTGPDGLGYWKYPEEEWIEWTAFWENLSHLDALILFLCCEDNYITSGSMKQVELYKEHRRWNEIKCNNTKYENELDEAEKKEYYSKLEILGLSP